MDIISQVRIFSILYKEDLIWIFWFIQNVIKEKSDDAGILKYIRRIEKSSATTLWNNSSMHRPSSKRIQGCKTIEKDPVFTYSQVLNHSLIVILGLCIKML